MACDKCGLDKGLSDKRLEWQMNKSFKLNDLLLRSKSFLEATMTVDEQEEWNKAVKALIEDIDKEVIRC